MADPPEDAVAAIEATCPNAFQRRSTHLTKPSGKVQDTLRNVEDDTAKLAAKTATHTAHGSLVESDGDAEDEGRNTSRGHTETARNMLQCFLDALAKISGEIGELRKMIYEQNNTIADQEELIQRLGIQVKELHYEQRNTNEELRLARTKLEPIGPPPRRGRAANRHLTPLLRESFR